MKKIIYLIPICALLVLTGCPQVFRDEEPIRHYTLGGVLEREAEPRNHVLSALSLGVRAPRVADYLDTRAIVVRSRRHEVDMSRHHRWGGGIDREIGKAVAGYLDVRAPFQRVDLVPFPPHAEHDYFIHIDVRRFEGEAPAGRVHLLADWEIISVIDRQVVASGTTDHRGPGWRPGDFPGLVERLDDALWELSGDLVAALVVLGPVEAAAD